MNAQKTALTIIALLTLVFFWFYSQFENYCFFYPEIDTRFSSYFSKSDLLKVSAGMNLEEVKNLLGEPLGKKSYPDGKVEWSYSGDGKAWFGDWAWYDYDVNFMNDVVISVSKEIRYD